MQKRCPLFGGGCKKTTTQYYENRNSGSGRDGEPSGEDAERQRPRHHHYRQRPETAFRRGESGRRDYRRGGFDDFRRAPQGFGAQVRPFHRREPRGERQRRGGDAGQEAGRPEVHRPHRQQRVPRTQQQGDVHRHGHRLPVLSRKGGGPRGHQPAGAHLDYGVCRFFERQTLAGGVPSGTGLAAGGTADRGLRRRRDAAELPHGGHHAGRRDDHPSAGRDLHRGRRDLRHRASGRREAGHGVLRTVQYRDQEHDDPRRFAHRHPHRHRIAGGGEYQAGRLQRREGLPAGGAARQDADNQRGWSQH